MHTPRLRLYTKNISYARMAQGALRLCGPEAIGNTERIIADYTKAKHAVLTSMGRMAIYEGLRALDRKGEIILSPITVPEVISLVILAGHTPVFCDIAPGTWNLDPSQVKPLITDKTVAIMTTHFYGNMNTTPAVRELCDTHKLVMVEDAAQAIGAWQNGHHAGTVGEFGILSFSYPKNVTSFYGGCMVTNNDALASRVREAIRDYPEVDIAWLYKRMCDCAVKDIVTYAPVFQLVAMLIQYGYRHNVRWIVDSVTQELNDTLLGEVPKHYLSRISPPQALALADKWREVDEDAAHRIRCAEIYYDALKNISGLVIPKPPGDRSNTFLYYPVQAEDKYVLQRYLIEHGCDVAIQHAANCADLPAYRAYHRDCPAARAAYKGTLMLPTWRGFPLKRAEHYARTIRRYYSA